MENLEGGYEDPKYGEINDWNEMRKFDDDHDNEWFKNQEQLLAEKYGGNFIKVKYANNGNVAYFCELCFAECNAKKSLDLHCGGMKHLKKKDMWEKEGKPPPNVFIMKAASSGEPSKERKRSRSPDIKKRLGRVPEKFPKSHSRSPTRGRNSPPLYWGRNQRYESPERDPYYRPPSGRYRPPSHFSREGSSYSHDDPYAPRGRRYPEHDRYSDYDNHASYEHEDSLSLRKRLSYPPRPRYGNRYSPERDTPPPPSPPRFHKSLSPSLARSSSPSPKENLSKSPAGNLLQKLSECCVKSTEDAELALNVVSSLLKSLKEYSQMTGEFKIAELLMEAELKTGTVKALKVGMKLLSNVGDTLRNDMPQNFSNPSSSSTIPNNNHPAYEMQKPALPCVTYPFKY